MTPYTVRTLKSRKLCVAG